MLLRHGLTLVAVVVVSARGAATARAESPITFGRVCSGPGIQCGARVAMRDGKPLVSPPIDIANLAPADIQAAYHIDPTLGTGVTIAIIDAYSYPALESDLAMYRKRFDLPACTVSNGCLRILNDQGQESPLPTGSDAGWEAETALDMDMVSAACPQCRIVVIQTEAGKLDAGERAAAALGVDTISASWGSIENGGEMERETSFHHPGIGTFAASGDNAYDAGGMGPEYPATSQYVVAVGGTKLQKNPIAGTYSETAWELAGSSCSLSIATPSFQPASASATCGMRASSDVSAEADPSTGVAVFESSAGGWLDVGGTSAATPIVAAMMAAAGHGDIAPDFIYRHPEAFVDVTSGKNGSCGNALCDAATGWDGPTGLGSPDQSILKTIGNGAGGPVTITSPASGSTQDPGFTIGVTVPDGTAHVDIAVDGERVAAFGSPFDVVMPNSVASGPHQVTITAFDGDHNGSSAQLMVTVTDGGCNASGGGSGIALGLLGVVAVTARRRRRVFPLNM